MLLETYKNIGPVGVVLIILSLITLYLFIKNVVFLWFINRDFLENFSKIEKGKIDILRDDISNNNVMLNILVDIARHHANHSKDIKSEVAYLFHKYFKKMTNGIAVLRLISVIAPLLGLMGTMIGMVNMFRSIGVAHADTSLLANGIWEALITTIMGLTVAIPTLCFYYFLQLRVKHFRLTAIEYSYRIVGIIDPRCPYGSKVEGGK